MPSNFRKQPHSLLCCEHEQERSLDYNELKIRILAFFGPSSEYQSGEILLLLEKEGTAKHRDKAVEMALLRYWRQGLLSRTRRQGRFYYRLTQRGSARRDWLTKKMRSSEA